jgi:prepilin-type N-terminal cleavage/methylation domain-containing protein
MSRNTKTRGFSLVEVMVALVVTCFGLILLLGIFPMAMKNADNLDISERMHLAGQQAMEQILLGNTYVNTIPTEMTPPPAQMPRDINGKPVGKISYWGEIPTPLGDPRFQKVYVEVTWQQGTRKQSFKITGYVAP